jgi:hypothetical protein
MPTVRRKQRALARQKRRIVGSLAAQGGPVSNLFVVSRAFCAEGWAGAGGVPSPAPNAVPTGELTNTTKGLI